MSARLKIPHHGLALVCDGHKALFLRNAGDEVFPNLQVEVTLTAPPNPLGHEQGEDRPGRVRFEDRRSAVEQRDPHEDAQVAFTGAVVRHVETVARTRPFGALLLAAPPRTLAVLREALPSALRRLVRAQINKDLTKLPTIEIERHLLAAPAREPRRAS